ncbi:MAG: ShlB/FhaC/HecB family hemolysin secretion/activation protein [Candidatus Methylophosphatis roskildensis]
MPTFRNAMTITGSPKTLTPSRARLRGAALTVALSNALALPQIALAQSVPSAGGVLRETAPPPPPTIPPSPDVAPAPPAPQPPSKAAPGGPAVTLTAIRFSGNMVFSSEELQPLVAERIGQPNTLADLEALAMRVTEKYRNAGYMLAQAIVPVQDVSSGVVEISVVEGALGKVRFEIDPAAPVRPAVIERIASRLKPGQPLHSRTLERVMLLLSDLPGIAPQAALEPGEASGTTDLIVVIAPLRRWDFSVDADNHGSRSTGEFRVGVLGRINSPLRLGDNLDARVQLGSGGGLSYGRLGYELPLGGEGTRIGAAYSRLDYELGKDFANLDGSGQADVFELTLTHPLIRARSRNLFGKIGWQEKWLDDRLRGQESGKRIRSLNAGLAYEQRDRLLGGGYSSASLTAFLGELRLDSETLRELDKSRQSEGHFEHWNYTVSRLNALTGKMNLFFGITGQFADKNLDSAEKIALGGPRAVRAYAPSEATVDEGHVANLELRYSLLPEVSLQGFYDWGWGRINRRPSAGDGKNDISLRGYGLGAYWGGANGFALRTSVAWRATPRGSADADRVPRLYVQLTKFF